jgi:hypothetical protein
MAPCAVAVFFFLVTLAFPLYFGFAFYFGFHQLGFWVLHMGFFWGGGCSGFLVGLLGCDAFVAGLGV